MILKVWACAHDARLIKTRTCTNFFPDILAPEKSYKDYGVISKTVPLAFGPPLAAVPYRFPAESMMSPPIGFDPSAPPVKLCRIVSTYPPEPLGESSNTTPQEEPWQLLF